jgi:ABC-type sugar transport system ATPase subunit
VTGSGRVAARLAPEAPVTAGDGHLGVRPSQVRWGRRPDDRAAHWLPATVRQVDPMGEDTLIYTLTGGEPVTIVEREPCTVSAGEEIHLAFPPAAVHLFIDGQRANLERDVAGPRDLAAAPAGADGD